MKTPPKSAQTNMHRWMVVDDDQHLLAIMRLLLKRLFGIEAACFESPLAALEEIAAHPDRFGLVITDFQMPEMDGVELHSRIKSLSPDLKIYLATGSGLFTPATARMLGFEGLLEKPISPETLQEMLTNCLKYN